MKVITFLAQKGGTGKSTLAFNAAVAAREAGESVVLVDVDPQGTSARWHQARPPDADDLVLRAMASSELPHWLAQMKRVASETVIIVDTPGKDDPEIDAVVTAADLCLIPRLGATACLDPVPLTWWRTRPPASFAADDRKRLVATLADLALLNIPRWRAAADGDPAAGIAVAFSLLPMAVLQVANFDAAMSAVLRCALCGDAACAAMLVHVLGRRGRRRTDLALVLLAGAWRRAALPSLSNQPVCDATKRS